MNWNYFWGAFIGIYSIPCLILFYFLGYRKARKGKVCNQYVMGTVMGYSPILHNGVVLPKVRYIVNGIEYIVMGPRFRYSVKINKSGFSAGSNGLNPRAGVNPNVANNPNMHQVPCGNGTWIDTLSFSNIPMEGPLPEVVKLYNYSSPLGGIRQDPMWYRYPVGKQVPVYYNPKKPKMSFVERYEGYSKFIEILMLTLSIVLIAAAIFVAFFAPEIVMQ